MDRAKALDRTRKLLRLAADQPGTAEAQSAQATAERLIQQHGLRPGELAEVVIESECIDTGGADPVGDDYWRRVLLGVLARYYSCETTHRIPDEEGAGGPPWPSWVIGDAEGVEKTIAAFTHLLPIVLRGCEVWQRQRGPGVDQVTFVATGGFAATGATASSATGSPFFSTVQVQVPNPGPADYCMSFTCALVPRLRQHRAQQSAREAAAEAAERARGGALTAERDVTAGAATSAPTPRTENPLVPTAVLSKPAERRVHRQRVHEAAREAVGGQEKMSGTREYLRVAEAEWQATQAPWPPPGDDPPEPPRTVKGRVARRQDNRGRR